MNKRTKLEVGFADVVIAVTDGLGLLAFVAAVGWLLWVMQ